MKYHTDYTRAFWEEHLNFGVEIFYVLYQKPKKCDIYQFLQYFFFAISQAEPGKVQDGFNFHFIKTC